MPIDRIDLQQCQGRLFHQKLSIELNMVMLLFPTTSQKKKLESILKIPFINVEIIW